MSKPIRPNKAVAFAMTTSTGCNRRAAIRQSRTGQALSLLRPAPLPTTDLIWDRHCVDLGQALRCVSRIALFASWLTYHLVRRLAWHPIPLPAAAIRPGLGQALSIPSIRIVDSTARFSAGFAVSCNACPVRVARVGRLSRSNNTLARYVHMRCFEKAVWPRAGEACVSVHG